MRTYAHTREGLRVRETGAPTLVTTEEKESAKAFEDRGKRRELGYFLDAGSQGTFKEQKMALRLSLRKR